MNFELNGHIDETGRPLLAMRAELQQWFKDNKGKDFTMSVKVRRKRRSNPQNQFYWGCIIPMVRTAMNAYGNTFSLETTHEFLKAQFNWKEVEVKDGQYIKVPQSTTELSTVDFMLYLDKIYLFAVEQLGIELPQPNQQMTLITVFDPTTPNAKIYDQHTTH